MDEYTEKIRATRFLTSDTYRHFVYSVVELLETTDYDTVDLIGAIHYAEQIIKDKKSRGEGEKANDNNR